MSSSFLVAYLVFEKNTEPDWQAGAKAIEQLYLKHLSEWPEYYLDCYASNWSPSFNSVTKEMPDMNDRVIQIDRLRKALEEVKKAWDGNYGDCAVIEIAGKDVLLSAGVSYGDPPSETYENIQYLQTSDVAAACGFQ